MSGSQQPIEYPPFCELCLKKFNTNDNALRHFQGPIHRNKVVLMSHRRNAENLICCDICCCQLNTLKALELHMQSPKHMEKVRDMEEISELKRQFTQTRSSSNSSPETTTTTTTAKETNENA